MLEDHGEPVAGRLWSCPHQPHNSLYPGQLSLTMPVSWLLARAEMATAAPGRSLDRGLSVQRMYLFHFDFQLPPSP